MSITMGAKSYTKRLQLIKMRHQVMSRGKGLLLPKLVKDRVDPHTTMMPSEALMEMAARYSIDLIDDSGNKKSSLEIIKAIDFLSKDHWVDNALGDNWIPSSMDDRGINNADREFRKEQRYHIISPESY